MKKRNGVRPYAVFLLFALMVTFGITQPYQAMAAIVTDTITYDSGDVYVGGYLQKRREDHRNVGKGLSERKSDRPVFKKRALCRTLQK